MLAIIGYLILALAVSAIVTTSIGMLVAAQDAVRRAGRLDQREDEA